MSDTHINAFYADVDEAKAEVEIARGKLEAAEIRLDAKKKELGITEDIAAKTADTPEDKPAEEKKTLFKKK